MTINKPLQYRVHQIPNIVYQLVNSSDAHIHAQLKKAADKRGLKFNKTRKNVRQRVLRVWEAYALKSQWPDIQQKWFPKSPSPKSDILRDVGCPGYAEIARMLQDLFIVTNNTKEFTREGLKPMKNFVDVSMFSYVDEDYDPYFVKLNKIIKQKASTATTKATIVPKDPIKELQTLLAENNRLLKEIHKAL